MFNPNHKVLYTCRNWVAGVKPRDSSSLRSVVTALDILLSLHVSLCSVLQGQQLKNPHLAVKHSPVAGGRLALVQGDYLYYHYMQDGFNDNVRTKRYQKSYYHDISVYKW